MRRASKGKKTGSGAQPHVAGRRRRPAKAKVKSKRSVAKARKRKGTNPSEPDKRLAEALEQQAATDEVLRVMASSPGDVQPVLYAVAERAACLCDALFAQVLLVEGDLLRPTAAYWADANLRARHDHPGEAKRPLPFNRNVISGRAALDGMTIHHADAVPFIDTEYPDVRAKQKELGWRAVLAVPLLRKGGASGVIFMFRSEPRPFSPDQIALVETFARQAAIAIDNARLFKETKQALEHQTATSEILRVISSSPTDVQPVFDIISERARKLCDAELSVVSRVEGEQIHLCSFDGVSDEAKETIRRAHPMPLTIETATGRAIRGRGIVHIADVMDDPSYVRKDTATVAGWRGCLAVPMLHEARVIGAIFVAHRNPGLFADSKIELLKTFADQAVIAIENVRLFNETKEALERQTATAEVLKVISESPTDVQPVFDAIAERAKTLCGARVSAVSRFDGQLVHLVAYNGVSPEVDAMVRAGFPMAPSRVSSTARAILECTPVQVEDVASDPDFLPPLKRAAGLAGYRSILAVPLFKDANVVGSITVCRSEAGPFPEKQIKLLQTFADQAVIAIENVRLFNETKEALERQTATSEVLEAISGAQADASPVFETIARNAHRLSGAVVCNVLRYDGSLLDIAASFGFSPEDDQQQRRKYPVKPGDASVLSGRVILSGKVEQIDDALRDPSYDQKHAAAHGARRILGVPMLRDGVVLGVIVVAWREPGQTPVALIDLLKTFADQAVIAIENVRLFNETKEALEQQTATSQILRVISQSPTDAQPVFDAILESGARLCEADLGFVVRYDAGMFWAVATLTPDPAFDAFVREPRRWAAKTGLGRIERTRQPVSIPDLLDDDAYREGDPGRLAALKLGGVRSWLGVPMLHQGELIGAIQVYRKDLRPFGDRQLALLQTFADQAVIAIENVRLFTELEARTVDLSRSVGELKALGEVGQAVSSTLDLETVLTTIVSRATQLAGMENGSIWEYDTAREEFYLQAAYRLPDDLVELVRATPLRKGEGAVGRTAVSREPVEIHDIANESAYPSRFRETLIRSGYRSVLAVPLLREDHLLGALAVNRSDPGEFAPEVIALLKTFATQSALAIQNARLYREIELKSRELETASRHKSEFLANMSHELRTPLNAIIGFSEVLSERMFGEINEKQAEYISDILQSGQHLLSLINDILDLSKIEAGRMELELSDFDLPGTIENTLTLVRERGVRRGIALGRTVDERLGTIHADERKVKQVLLNLLSNALKFTPEGGQIDVRAAVNDGVAEISVTDTGVGISPEDQEAVFEEFRQVGTASKKVEGTGLGLAISRKFIELHGGKIWVKSTIGSGSTFIFTLPLR